MLFYIDDLICYGCKREECLLFYACHLTLYCVYKRGENWIILLVLTAWFIKRINLIIKKTRIKINNIACVCFQEYILIRNFPLVVTKTKKDF